MHLCRGNYGQNGFAAGGQEDGSYGSAAAHNAGYGSAAVGGSTSAGRSVGRPNARPIGGLSAGSLRSNMVDDSDDVEDILQQVRRDVAFIQHAAPKCAVAGGASLEHGQCSLADHAVPAVSSGSRQGPQGPPSARGLNRSASEATWDRPRTSERQDEVPRALPKATVRGRYVFSGGAQSEVLAGGGHQHNGNGLATGFAASDFASTEFTSQFSPRPTGRSSEPRQRSCGQKKERGQTRGMAEYVSPSIAECMEIEAM